MLRSFRWTQTGSGALGLELGSVETRAARFQLNRVPSRAPLSDLTQPSERIWLATGPTDSFAVSFLTLMDDDLFIDDREVGKATKA